MGSTIVSGGIIGGGIGDRIVSIVDHTGPASYAQLANGGDALTARECGMGWIESVLPMGLDDTGVYAVLGESPDDAIPRDSIPLQWNTAQGMTEVAAATDLSAKHIRLVVIGR